MRTFLLLVLLTVGPWFVLPPLLAVLFGICIGIPVATWHSMRHTFPKRTDSDVLSCDPA